jgi:hypothetical protein
MLSIVIVGSCKSESADRAGGRVRVQLADSVRFENELIGVGYLRRVAVRTEAGIDTLANIVTDQQPVVAGDSVVYGLIYDQQAVTAGFAYDARASTVRRLTLPSELFPYAAPKLSPDGRHLAYLAMDTAGRGYGAIAAWPSGGVIYRGQPVRMLETDASIDPASWLDANRFEIRIELSHFVGGGTQRIRGTVSAPDSTVVDTIRR